MGYLIYYMENSVKKYCQVLGHEKNHWTPSRDHAKVFVSKIELKGCSLEEVETVECYSISNTDVPVVTRELKLKESFSEILKPQAKTKVIAAIDKEMSILSSRRGRILALE